jgi:Fic family protein
MHRMFYKDIDASAAGRYRDRQVFITGSKYPVCKPERIAGEMEALFSWAASERDKYHPVEFDAQLHKRFVFIHPFIDGNGRTARLLMNLALIQAGYGIAIIPPVRRGEYIDVLRLSQRAKNPDNTPFLSLIVDCVIETQKDYCRLLELPVRDTDAREPGQATPRVGKPKDRER